MRIEEQEYTKNFDIRIWKRVLPFLKPFKKTVAVIVIFNLTCSLVDIAMPLFQRYAIDTFIEQKTLDGIWKFGLVYFLVVGFQFLSVVLFTRGSASLEMYLGKTMKRACFVHLQELSFSYYNVTPVGYILSRVMSDTDRIAGMVAWNLTDMMWALVYVLGVFAAMLALNWKLALIIMSIVPALAVLTWYFQNKILRWNRKVRKINSRITSGYNEGIMGAQTSKTLVIEEKNLGEFQEVTEEMRTAAIRAARLSAVYVPLVLFCGSLATAIVVGKGGQMVLDNLLMIGTLSAFTSYAVGIFEPIQQLARNLAELISIQANIERVTTLLDQKPTVKDSPEVVEKYGDTFQPKKENWEPIRGDIEFQDVSFRYPDGKEDVLSHFNLKVPAGTTIAIVGETGAGKSTLVNLACRFFEPTEGRILIDGRITGNAVSSGCTAVSGMYCKVLICFPAPLRTLSAMGGWMPQQKTFVRPHVQFPPILWRKNWRRDIRPMLGREAGVFPPGKNSWYRLPVQSWQIQGSLCWMRQPHPLILRQNS